VGAELGSTQQATEIGSRPRTWAAYSHSVKGEGHKRRSMPCQDASAAGVLGGGKWAYAIVADGHGSSRHFRSDRGARIAVEVLRETFEAVAGGPSEAESDPQGEGLTPAIWSEWAASHVVARWRSRVWADLLQDPPVAHRPATTEPTLEQHLEEVLSRDGRVRQALLVLQIEAFREFAAAHSPQPGAPLPLSSDATWDATALGTWQASAYGTTLLGVLVGPHLMLLLQQGDGAIVEIRGGKASYAVPPPPEAIANATPSMCNDDAVNEVIATTRSVSATDSLTGLLLTTDGIPNSYTTLEGFFSFCSDIVVSGLREPGLEDKLRQWLPQISAKGSQDDMSIALLLRPAATVSPTEASRKAEQTLEQQDRSPRVVLPASPPSAAHLPVSSDPSLDEGRAPAETLELSPEFETELPTVGGVTAADEASAAGDDASLLEPPHPQRSDSRAADVPLTTAKTEDGC